jgi:pyruvate formate lyase activating enzyme
MTTKWKTTFSPARLAEKLPDGRIRCHLSPRNCTMREGQDGFCKVRGVRDGELVTMNFGKSVHPTQETIETEAVNHFLPGAKILSFGNIGCMMSCSYCHNWRTSQAKYVQDSDIYAVTPEEAVALAKRRGLGVISYTYNDPVVWHEWVLETAQRAREAGLINLYKSAFYISEEAIDELLPHIDIFSISLKSMDPHYYKKITAARLEPVLDGIRQVYRSGRHLELSNLMITDLSDDEASARKLAEFVLQELDETVPMHYVRFHPDYRMRNTTRTPIPRLEKALEAARSMGVQHVYLGNVYDTPHSNTYCNGCSAQLVTRYGLNASTSGLTDTGHCKNCGTDAHIKLPRVDLPPTPVAADSEISGTHSTFDWHGDVRSLHVHMHTNKTDKVLTAWHRRRLSNGERTPWEAVTLQPAESWRFIIAKSSTDDVGPEIVVPDEMNTNLHEVFDRAHFPTVSVEEAPASGDVTPFPLYEGHTAKIAR